MQEIEIEVVRLETLQAALACLERAAPASVARQDLADEVHLLAPTGDSFGDELFGAAVAVHLSGIDELQPEVESRAQCCELFAARGALVAHRPGTLTQARDGNTGR